MPITPRPEDAAAMISVAVFPFLGQMLDVNLQSRLIGVVFPILWAAQLDTDHVFFRTIGGLLVEVWTGIRDEGPEWVRNQPPGLYSPSTGTGST